MIDHRLLSPKWYIYVKPLLPRSEGTAEEGVERLEETEAVGGYKERMFSEHSRTAAHINSQQL